MKVQFTLETEALVEELSKAKFDQEVFVCLLHLLFLREKQLLSSTHATNKSVKKKYLLD